MTILVKDLANVENCHNVELAQRRNKPEFWHNVENRFSLIGGALSNGGTEEWAREDHAHRWIGQSVAPKTIRFF